MQAGASIEQHARALRHKYTQKFMGGPTEGEFHHTSIDADKDPHEVPLENFLNAQCAYNEDTDELD